MTDEMICALYYIARNTSLAEFKDRIRALLADGGKDADGEAYAKGYRAGKAFAQRHAPQAECAPRDYVERDLVARARRIMEAVDAYNSRPDGDNRHALRSVLMDELEALKAECAPREAQPDPYAEWFVPYYEGVTPERADAEKDAALTDEVILDEFERRAMKLRDFMGYPNPDGVRVIEGVRAILAAKEKKS